MSKHIIIGNQTSTSVTLSCAPESITFNDNNNTIFIDIDENGQHVTLPGNSLHISDTIDGQIAFSTTSPDVTTETKQTQANIKLPEAPCNESWHTGSNGDYEDGTSPRMIEVNYGDELPIEVNYLGELPLELLAA